MLAVTETYIGYRKIVPKCLVFLELNCLNTLNDPRCSQHTAYYRHHQARISLHPVIWKPSAKPSQHSLTPLTSFNSVLAVAYGP